MTIDDRIRDEKLQYDINREAAKMSVLSSDKIGIYEYLTGEEILPSKICLFSFGKIKATEDQGQKQVEALKTFKSDNEKLTIEDVIPKSALNNNEAIKELDKIKEIEKTIDREKLVYRASEYTYNFRNFWTIRTFGRDIYEGRITLKEADDDQENLLNEIRNFRDKTKPQNVEKKQEKKLFLITCVNFLRQEKYFLMVLIVEYFW